MKVLFSTANGAFSVTEDQGKVSINFDESLGGGEAAGVVKGQGSIILDAVAGVKLGEQLLNAHLPATMLPVAQVVEGIANQALATLE